MKKFNSVTKIQKILHGADYNPDQWLDSPDILTEDLRLMNIAKCNAFSVGIFAWTKTEPDENIFDFDWLDNLLDNLHKNGQSVFLATPTGARPTWLSAKYPEVLRVEANRKRNLYGDRHNHCMTSPIYREKVTQINKKLAQRYGNHPAVIGWHISNEYGGECHCDLCQEKFRQWLKEKFDNNLEKLNKEYWTYFWSHTFTDWSQIQSPAPHGDNVLHGLKLDWMRFTTYNTVDFIKNEIEALREYSSELPVTTNFMESFEGLDYSKIAPHLDFISWDSYPRWRGNDNQNIAQAISTAFNHDIFRSLKNGKPFILMESTPSKVNWQPVNNIKKPNQHILSSLQAVSHGSDSVMYFQWRKGRGGFEKFHGAVVDHEGTENTRVFKEVAELGNILNKLDEVVGTYKQSEVAVIYDTENRWALRDMKGLRNDRNDYLEVCLNHYGAFWKNNIPVDVIDMDVDFSKYKLVVAPMLYMLKPTVAERLTEFVKKGGTLVSTFWSGVVNENDLCILGGLPGRLKDVLGVWAEEIDVLEDFEFNSVFTDQSFGLKKNYRAKLYCDIIHATTSKILATYSSDFYAETPALTENDFGAGKAYYIAFNSDADFLDDFYEGLVNENNITKSIAEKTPLGVSIQKRSDGEFVYIFILNMTNQKQNLILDETTYYDMILQNEIEAKDFCLNKFESRILRTKINE